MKKYTPILLCVISSMLIFSCSTPKIPIPVNKTLVVRAGPNINKYNNSANPIVIRLYQLSSRTEFNAATFWELFNNESADLSGVVLDKNTLSPLYPEESRLVAIDLEPDVFYLGVFAEFANFELQEFRDAVPVSADLLDNGMTVSITASGIALKYRNSTE